MNIRNAQKWYRCATEEFKSVCSEQGSSRLHLEVFVRAITATLFGKDGRSGFPETLYLDCDRLQIIRAQIEDHIFLEVCLDMFAGLLKQFRYQGRSLSTTRQQLVSSLIAIMGDTSVGYGPHQWMANSEALSLEILRQASTLANRTTNYDFDNLSKANQYLRHLFFSTFTTQARNLEAVVLPMILSTMETHSNSSPMELFNKLVPITTSSPIISTLNPTSYFTDTFSSSAHLHPDGRKLSGIANRISHIIILHWRIWSKIAYVQEDAVEPRCTSSSTHQASGARMLSSMRTGEATETETGTAVSHETPL